MVTAEVMDGAVVRRWCRLAAEISMVTRRLARRCIIVPSGSSARAVATAAARDLGRDGIEVVIVDVRSAARALPALTGAE